MIKTRNRRLFSALAVLLVVAAVFVGVWYVMKRQDRVAKTKDVRNERLNELELRAGEYDEYSIVLSDTSRSAATALAKELDAKLRITSDGSFATLTLTDGRTIKDIYSNDAYLSYIDQMSTDWQATVGRYHGGDEEHPIPSAPTGSGSNKAELQAYLELLNLSTVWNTTKGQGTTVAIIDTGIDTDHPEFSGRISEYSYNATEDKIVKDYLLSDGSYDWSLVEDEQGHGTAVAGAFAASMNGKGMVGVAPQVTVIVIKAECDQNGTFARTSDLVFGLYYAIERDVAVVNMSFGTYGPNPFSEATQLAYDSDVLCIAAAGNDSTAALCYPAADEHVIGVGALSDGSWELADYSNYGENVDIVAPGTVYTTALGGGYTTMTGTSLASPLVSGALSLLSSTDKYITFDEVCELLIASSCDLGDLGHDYYYGYGAIDVSALLLEERGTITYDMMTDELDDTEGLFIVGHTLQAVPEPERLYAIFDGWYYDPYYTEEYVWYEDAIHTDITVYAKWENEEDGIPYTYVELEDGTIEIRSYTGRRRYITIPEYIDGKLVTSIGDLAFDGQSALREIVLPSGLKHIGLYAFRNCSNLRTISIPSGVTEIEAGAFYGNVRLSTVAFVGTPQLRTVGEMALAFCSSLGRLEIPASVTSIGTGVFCGDVSLTEITVQRANTHFVDVNGVLFNATKSTLLAYPAARTADHTVPSGTTTIADYAFAYAHLGKIDLNETVSIGASAFECSYLSSVTVPNSVRSMGSAAFANCARLSDVTFGEDTRLTVISQKAFFACSSLQTIAIPNAVTAIGGSAFRYSALRSVTFGANSALTSIGGSAFSGTPLQSIALPKSLNTIGGSAFSGCSFLSEVTFGEGSNLTGIGSYAFAYTASLTAFAFPDRLTQLGDFAFLSSALDGNVTLPASLTYLGSGAFASCQSLVNIFVHAENTAYCDRDGVVYTKDGKKLVAYPAGNERTSYPIAEGVETVAAAAFYGSPYLQSVTLPESLVYIEEYAFAYVTALSSMAIPNGIMQIGRYAFLYDMAMSAITFGEDCALPRIGYGAFAYCGITSITIPKNVSTIAQGAFMGCTKLVGATFAKNSKLQSISAYLFDGASELRTIKFENGSALTSIQAHGLEGMTKLTSVDFGDAHLTNIDNFAFRFCESLTSFTVPSGVTNIGRYAFYGCYGLGSVTVPESVEHIGSYAFLQTSGRLEVYFAAEVLPTYLDEDWDRGIRGYYLGVTSVTTSGDYRYATLTSGGIAILEYLGTDTEIDLSAATLGGSITTIGGSAFAYSTVERIVLPETLVTIQRSGFYHSALTSITLPASVEFIGTEAFADTPITSVTFASGSRLTAIEQSAFEGTKHLTASVTIPASVTALGRAIFRNSAVTDVRFESGTTVTEIPIEMFCGSALRSFDVPNSVIKLCDGAFEGTADLKTITYGENLTWLGARAFYQSGVESFHIRKTLTVIEEFALVSLENLTAFTIDADHPYYMVENGLLLSKDASKLVVVPAGMTGFLTVPVSVEKIGYGAFEASALSAVRFDDSCNLLSIGYRAFFGAESLTEITVPSSVVAIDYYAFAYAKNLQKVTFADGSQLKGIYEGAFYGCLNLSDITVPDSIVEISDYAFYGCTKLKKLPVSETSEVKGIYDYAFAYSGIDGDFVLPKTLLDVGDYAFCGTATVRLTIPKDNQYDLFIGLGAWYDCTELEEVDLPFVGASYEEDKLYWFTYIFGAGTPAASKTYMPPNLRVVKVAYTAVGNWERVFNNCFDNVKNTITEVVLPNGLLEVGGASFIGGYNSSFSDCICLKKITIPDSVKRIGDFAFVGCTALQEVLFGDNCICELGQGSFRDCASLSKMTFSESNPFYSSVQGIVYNKEKTKIIYVPDGIAGAITLPDNITSLDGNCFCGRKRLTSITIPASVTRIDDFTFYGCTNLHEIVNLSDLQFTFGSEDYGYIAYYAKVLVDKNGSKTYREYDFTYLQTEDDLVFEVENGVYTLVAYLGTDETLILPVDINGNSYTITRFDGRMKHIVLPAGMTTIDAYAFEGCTALVRVTMPDSITSLGNYAFKYCENLTEIKLSQSLLSMGHGAFSYCAKLQQIAIPNGVKQISPEMFRNCSNLTTVMFDADSCLKEIGWSAFAGCSNLKIFTIPQGVIYIGDSAFYGCLNLRELMIPQGVSYIGDSTFTGFNGKVAVANNSQYFCEADGILYNKDKTKIFFVSKNLSGTVTIPDSIQSFSSAVFSGCANIEGVIFSKNSQVTKLPNDMFNGCSSLKQIILPDGLTDIGSNCFYGCTSLSSIVFPSELANIGRECFYGCIFLQSVVIPKSVTNIGYSAFGACKNLNSITVEKGNLVYHSVGDCLITIEGQCLIQGCKNSIIPEDGCVTKIGAGAFRGCSSLMSITIPKCITFIAQGAFSGCSGLTQITILCNSVSIEVGTFNECKHLYKVINHSELPLSLGSADYGHIAYYAEVLEDQNGNRTYRDDSTEHIVTKDEFCFAVKNGNYTLIAYTGNEETITLPVDINGNEYSIYKFRGVPIT